MPYSPEQISRYLARIGVTGGLPKTQEALSRIVSAHYRTVPYENLDILRGRPLGLNPDALYRKIVENRRGGFCFELNAALGNLLEGLGFSVTRLAARFLRGEPRMALPLVYGQTFSDGMGEYRLERDSFYGTVLLQRLREPEFVPFFGFTMEPQTPGDYVMPCFFCEKHPDSPFVRGRMVGIYTETGSWNLVGNSLRRLENGVVAERRELPEEEIPGILERIFGIPRNQ